MTTGTLLSILQLLRLLASNMKSITQIIPPRDPRRRLLWILFSRLVPSLFPRRNIQNRNPRETQRKIPRRHPLFPAPPRPVRNRAMDMPEQSHRMVGRLQDPGGGPTIVKDHLSLDVMTNTTPPNTQILTTPSKPQPSQTPHPSSYSSSSTAPSPSLPTLPLELHLQILDHLALSANSHNHKPHAGRLDQLSLSPNLQTPPPRRLLVTLRTHPHPLGPPPRPPRAPLPRHRPPPANLRRLLLVLVPVLLRTEDQTGDPVHPLLLRQMPPRRRVGHQKRPRTLEPGQPALLPGLLPPPAAERALLGPAPRTRGGAPVPGRPRRRPVSHGGTRLVRGRPPRVPRVLAESGGRARATTTAAPLGCSPAQPAKRKLGRWDQRHLVFDVWNRLTLGRLKPTPTHSREQTKTFKITQPQDHKKSIE
ncbi:hypothetical protein PG993_006248 [Apiospora rasikravindrae]|uniref:Uncharacterized protein n=1 Tax=Apiospora rasikravindrae TaxID=990691 RepID=A0ABR1T551_9PEZI